MIKVSNQPYYGGSNICGNSSQVPGASHVLLGATEGQVHADEDADGADSLEVGISFFETSSRMRTLLRVRAGIG